MRGDDARPPPARTIRCKGCAVDSSRRTLTAERGADWCVFCKMESTMHRFATLLAVLFLSAASVAIITVVPQPAYADGCGGQGH